MLNCLGIAITWEKIILTWQCFNCKDFSHISSKYCCQALVIEERNNVIDEPLENIVYEPKLDDFGDLGNNEDTSLGDIQTLSENLDNIPFVPNTSWLRVVCCIRTQTKQENDFTSHFWKTSYGYY